MSKGPIGGHRKPGRPKRADPMRTVMLRLERADYELLTRLAEKGKTTKSDAVRLAIRYFAWLCMGQQYLGEDYPGETLDAGANSESVKKGAKLRLVSPKLRKGKK